MSQCDNCHATILFGGFREGDFRFCSANCRDQGMVLVRASMLPEDLIEGEAKKIHESPCPLCGGEGPLDAHSLHWVWSGVMFTRWGTKQLICCRSCGRKGQLKNAAFSLVFGWWGFPWGLIFTPVQVGRNLRDALAWSDIGPSDELRKTVRIALAQRSLGAGG
ncbi:MAG TPA: hypothetical protein VG406_21665 [Isosphaeraceae bacterium]|jgi:hypothetical protein|nr:hypothetical protein [Isosphaeraceae bacterium]